MIKHVKRDDVLYAIIVKGDFNKEGVTFFTPDHLSQQLAYMRHPPGTDITPHTHNRISREIHFTQEVLVLKKGRMRVDFYDRNQVYFESYILEGGDIILLCEGGHGFKILEPVEMIEVKQGPFSGPGDKTVFEPVHPDKLNIQD
jgi:mannose-6-phosphate isomerase-like protein (cupin superfamily)